MTAYETTDILNVSNEPQSVIEVQAQGGKKNNVLQKSLPRTIKSA